MAGERVVGKEKSVNYLRWLATWLEEEHYVYLPTGEKMRIDLGGEGKAAASLRAIARGISKREKPKE